MFRGYLPKNHSFWAEFVRVSSMRCTQGGMGIILMRIWYCLTLAIGVAFGATSFPSVSHAQSSEECLCLVPDRGSGQPIGSILEAIGQVQVSQVAGFNAASAGTSLNRGDRIIVGPNSNAQISVLPDCRRQIPANSDVVLDPVAPNICVRLIDKEITAAQLVGRVVIGGALVVGWWDIINAKPTSSQ